MMDGTMRLDKFLADMGIGTRSQIKDMAKKGRIQVNGVTVRKADGKIEPDRDEVVCDGVKVAYAEYEYYMLNKPQGVVSATKDNLHETVIDLIKKKPPRKREDETPAAGNGNEMRPGRKGLFPVGRLDIDTEGLLLITNDGELAHGLLSPKRHVDKKYFAMVTGTLPGNAREKFREGITLLDGTRVMPAELEILETGQTRERGLEETERAGEIQEPVTELILTIQEGRFHQVKRMFQALGCQVVFLKRLSMGSLELDKDLEPGEYRPLLAEEVEKLKA